MKFFRKYHKWVSIVVGLFIIIYVLSGIILNHREAFSSFEISRSALPSNYQFNNWNNGAIKGVTTINNDSVVVYGEIGIWLSDSAFTKFSEFNKGFNEGIDNKKANRVLFTKKHKLFAGTQFGLYCYNFQKKYWNTVQLPVTESRVVDLIEKQDTLLVLTRSHLLSSVDGENFNIVDLPQSEDFDNKVSLFFTFWTIHSGDIYGLMGKFIVDFFALILLFLTVTGIILLFNKRKVKRNIGKNRDNVVLLKTRKWSLNWHNKIGWISIVFLLITVITGMFLRPPFLITIANSQVKKIPYSTLDSDNPWSDNLRRIFYDSINSRFLLSTNKGLYYSDDNFSSKLKRFKNQPPVSVMGMTVLNQVKNKTYLIGSFEGLFYWNSSTGNLYDVIERKPYIKNENRGRPIGKYLVTGFFTNYTHHSFVYTYNRGVITIGAPYRFVSMPESILSKSSMSLWNVALEFHTGRIFQFLLGDFYILIVPLVGLSILFILISGFVVWYKYYRGRNKN